MARRAVRRSLGRHGDGQGQGRARRRHPRLRRSDQRAHDREPDPGRSPPGRLLRALRGPGARPRQRPDAQSRTSSSTRSRAPSTARRSRRSLVSVWDGVNNTQLGRNRRAVHRPDRGRDRERRFARPRRARSRSSRSRRRSCLEPLLEASKTTGRPVMKPFTLVHATSLAEASRESAKPDAELKAGRRRPARPHEGRLRHPEGRRLDRRHLGPGPHRGRPSGRRSARSPRWPRSPRTRD